MLLSHSYVQEFNPCPSLNSPTKPGLLLGCSSLDATRRVQAVRKKTHSSLLIPISAKHYILNANLRRGHSPLPSRQGQTHQDWIRHPSHHPSAEPLQSNYCPIPGYSFWPLFLHSVSKCLCNGSSCSWVTTYESFLGQLPNSSRLKPRALPSCQ